MQLHSKRIAFLFTAASLAGTFSSLAHAQSLVALARLGTDGSRDTTFSSDGKRTFDVPGCTSEAGADVAIASGNKVVVAVSDCGFNGVVLRFGSDGVLDPTFGSDGIANINLINPQALAIDSSGRIVVAGNVDGFFAVARLTSSGTVDTAWGGGGAVHTSFPGRSNAFANGVAIQSDGKIVVAGRVTDPNSGTVMAVARYNTSGSLDTTFDGDGRMTIDFATSTDEEALDVAIGPNGKAVVGGYAIISGGAQFASARINTNGTLDTTFNHDGKVLTDYASSLDEYGWTVAVDSTNRVYVGGWANVNGGELAVTRVTSAGELDTSYNHDGKVLTDITSSDDEAVHEIKIQSNGKVVAAGIALIDGGYVLASARWNTDGSRDTTYDGDGAAFVGWANHIDEYAFGVAIDSSGRIVLAGETDD